MTNPVAQLRPWVDLHGNSGTKLYLWCPGCDQLHGPEVVNPAKRWQWDGNLEAPTLSPSILTHGTQRCHSFLKAGQWQFLVDCEHALAGKTVPMVPLPDWLIKEGA